MHLHCSHRNASLEFGVIEERGLRCCYHGWLYDADGSILEMPAQSMEGKTDLCHGAYPVVEYQGLMFAYMGPADEKPEFPRYDTTQLPDVELVPYSIDYPCNWLQICENTMDPWHTVFLHARVTDIHFGDTWGIAPVTRFYEMQHKIYATLTYRVEDMIWVRSQETISPSFSQVGAWWETGREEKYFKRASITKWTIPHDDDHCMIIAWRSFGDGIDPAGHGKREDCGKNKVDFPRADRGRTLRVSPAPPQRLRGTGFAGLDQCARGGEARLDRPRCVLPAAETASRHTRGAKRRTPATIRALR